MGVILIAAVSLGVLAAAVPMLLKELSYRYCARPDGLFITDASFEGERAYPWSDVRAIKVYCYHSARTYSFNFELELSDGLTVRLREGPLTRNYAAVSAALRGVPFRYDTSRLKECLPEEREYFAKRPGGD